jgi:TRAP-type mannitol/chloroaromatic compound transport system permease small subunit
MEGVHVQTLLGFSRFVDRLNTRIGQTVGWLILVAVMVSAINAIIRKAFNASSNAWLETQWYLFGAVFMLCAAYTFLRNEHIRIDIVSGYFPKRMRDWIDVIGHIFFLLPFCIIIIYYGVPFALHSISDDPSTLLPGLLVISKNAYLGLRDLIMSIWTTPPYRVVETVPAWEQSMNAGGLYLWPAKFLVPIGFFLLFLQGLSELIKRVAIMRDIIPDTEGEAGHQAALEAEAERLLQQAAPHP